MQDIEAALSAADFATDSTEICLKGSLVAQWERAELAVAHAHDAIVEAQEKGMPTAPLVGTREEALAAFEAIEKRMHEASVKFTLTGVDEAQWKAVLIANPPREGYQIDQMLGYDTSGKAGAGFIRLCLVEPQLTDDQWARLRTKLTDAQFAKLLTMATDLNRSNDGTIPFSSAVSEVIRASSETSTAPSSSESAPSASGDGAPAKAPKAAKRSSGTRSNET